MEKSKTTISFFGIGIGAIALMLALVHFWAGPFSPQPTLEEIVAEKAVSIRDATIAALKGEKKLQEVPPANDYDYDRLTSLVTSVLGALAVILGVIALATREPGRAAGGAVLLGAGALAFQFFIIAVGVIALVLLVGAVLGEIGIG